MIRAFDFTVSLFGLILSAPLMLLIYIICLFDTGAPIFRQERVGRERIPFTLFKFRTMYLNTPSIASHLADYSAITSFGRFLRRTKLDELPQLWNVLIGDMSLVGPRPCLYNQTKVIRERALRGIFRVRPGITGLAQINNIDMSRPKLLAETDEEMLNYLTISSAFKYILLTLTGKGTGDVIKGE